MLRDLILKHLLPRTINNLREQGRLGLELGFALLKALSVKLPSFATAPQPVLEPKELKQTTSVQISERSFKGKNGICIKNKNTSIFTWELQLPSYTTAPATPYNMSGTYTTAHGNARSGTH